MVQESGYYVQTVRNSIFLQCAYVPKNNIPICAHINPITLFSVHVNTIFRFINRNEFNLIEPKIVHVNLASVVSVLVELALIMKWHLDY